MARPGFSGQLGTLVDRTIAVLLGGPGTLAILLLQPPLVGVILGLGWQNQEATPATYLCMAIAAIYIGCMNAATVIVRERPILDRERMFCLNIWSYLLSKTLVLAVVCVLQMVLMLVAQAQLSHLPAGTLNHALLLLFLSLTGLAATTLGLAISAFASSSYMAVILVPVLIIPQIVFSEVVLGETGISRRFPELFEKVTITKWGYEALRAVGDGGELSILLRSGSLLLLLMGLFLSLAALKLKLDG